MSHDQLRPGMRRKSRPKVRSSITVSEVIILLRKLEQHRTEVHRHQEAIATYTSMLQQWLKWSDEFAEAWTAFSAAGGVSAKDFHAFIHDRFPGRPLSQQQKHLRLVVTNDQAQ